MMNRSTGARRPAARTATRPAQRRASTGRPMSAYRRYALIKWALLAALLVYGFLVVGANSARDVDFAVIAQRMAHVNGLGHLDSLDENAFQDRLGTSPEGCEGWLMYGAEAVMDVSELMVAKADEATLDRLEEAVQARLEAQLDVFRGYGVDQAQLLEDAAVLRRGSYLFYAVDANADQWEDAFLSCIR